jgi:hypothetical protein
MQSTLWALEWMEAPMRSQFSLPVAFWLFFLAVSPGALAQASRGIFVTPIANAPFMAVVNVQRTRIQRDGTVVNLKSIRAIARGSNGQIYNETRALLPADATNTPPITGILLYDPQTRTNAFINPQEKTAWVGTVGRPPATVPPDLYAAPTGNSLPVSQFTKEEELGTRTMEGVPVHGVRETQMIPAAQNGSGKEVTITDEYWYSDDLRLNLIVKHDEPRFGSVTMTVTQVTRSEPNASIFEVPAGYKLIGPTASTRQ